MATEKSVPRKAPARLAKKKFAIHTVADTEPSVIEDIEVTALEIDEAYDAECDPYNSTGQFLVGALKDKYDE